MIKQFGAYYLITVICLAIGLKTAYREAPTRDYLLLTLFSSETGVTELFFDSGSGFNAVESIQQEVSVAEKFSELAFEIPRETEIVRLRWDPVYSESGVQTVLKKIVFSYFGGEVLKEVPLNTVEPMNHISDFSLDDSEVRFSVRGGQSDPNLLLSSVPSRPTAPKDPWIHAKAWGFSLLAAGILAACYRALIWYFNS
jgi:hypothetical protein